MSLFIVFAAKASGSPEKWLVFAAKQDFRGRRFFFVSLAIAFNKPFFKHIKEHK
jgi:hypothetical protein